MAEQLAQRQQQQPGLTLDMVVELTGYQPAEIALISRTVAVGAPLQELAVFLHACRSLKLDPLLRQAYWIRRGNPPKGVLQVGIDGFRAIADSSGAYAGSEPPLFRGSVKIKDRVVPEKAAVTVWRIVQGHKSAFTGEAHFMEFYPGDGADGAMWRKMPHRMLAKTAEAEALRKGFPAQLASVTMAAEAGEDGAQTFVQEAQPRQLTAADYTRVYGEDDDEPPVAQPQVPAQPAEPPEDPRLAVLWQRHDDLATEATALKLRVPTQPRTATLAQLRAANAELSRQIAEAQKPPPQEEGPEDVHE